MPATGACSGPGGYSSKQRGSRQGERHDDGAATGSSDRCFRIGDGRIHPPLGIGSRLAGSRSHLLDEITLVVVAYAAMARGGHQNAAGLGPLRTEIYILRSPGGAKQLVKFVTQEWFGSAGVCRGVDG